MSVVQPADLGADLVGLALQHDALAAHHLDLAAAALCRRASCPRTAASSATALRYFSSADRRSVAERSSALGRQPFLLREFARARSYSARACFAGLDRGGLGPAATRRLASLWYLPSTLRHRPDCALEHVGLGGDGGPGAPAACHGAGCRRARRCGPAADPRARASPWVTGSSVTWPAVRLEMVITLLPSHASSM